MKNILYQESILNQLDLIAKEIVIANINRKQWNDCNPYGNENDGIENLLSILNSKTDELLSGNI